MLNLRPPVPGAAVKAAKAGVRSTLGLPELLQPQEWTAAAPGGHPTTVAPSQHPVPHTLISLCCPLTLHAVPQLLALLGLSGLGVGVWPVGLARGGPCLAVLSGWGRPGLGATVQSMSPVWGVGGLRGLGRGQLLEGCLVRHAVIHARDRGLLEEMALRAGAELCTALSLSSIKTALSSQLCYDLSLRCGLTNCPPQGRRLGAELLSCGPSCQGQHPQ